MKLSQRVPAALAPSDFERAIAQFAPRLDLTCTNPTRCGFSYPDALLREALQEVEGYDARPAGWCKAREMVAEIQGVSPKDVVLCASTSEAYGLLFRALLNAGDSVAVPVPGYPLIPFLVQAEGGTAKPYRWSFNGARWELDVDSLRQALQEGAKVVVHVQPQNPTGAMLNNEERQMVWDLCAQHDAVLVCDEVFAPYACEAWSPSAPGQEGPVAVTLGGLSKWAALPQLKLSWMTFSGDELARRRLYEGVEWLADLYLNAATPVQRALPAIMRWAPDIQAQIRSRVEANRTVLARLCDDIAEVSLLPSAGGWMGLLHLPRVISEEEWCFRFAAAGVKLQPVQFHRAASPI